MENGKVAFYFIGTAVVVGVGCYFVHKYLKEKTTKPSIDEHKAPQFTAQEPQKIHEVEQEQLEPLQEEKKQPSQAEIIFNNACYDTLQKRLGMASGMSPVRKRKIINAVNNLNCNPQFKAEKIRMYNMTMAKKDYNLLQKMIFDWAIKNSR